MNKQIKIELDLNDILSYTLSTLEYLRNENNDIDKGEIIMYLSCVPEIIEEIKNILIEMEVKKNDKL